MRMWMAAAIIALTAGAATAHEAPEPPAVDALAASDPVEWRIAQVRVARAGRAVLPRLDAFCAEASAAHRERIRETVALMLLKSIDESDLVAHENLGDLCRDDIARARALTAALRVAKHYSDGSPPLGPTPLPPREAFEAAVVLGGMAVPAAVDLCRGPSPAGRLYGLELLRTLDATAQRDLIESMGADDTRIDVQSGCEMHRTSVGAVATHIRFSSSPFLTCAADEDRPPLLAEAREYVLWLDLRTDARLHEAIVANGVREATSWDDYWSRARPALAAVLTPERAAAGNE